MKVLHINSYYSVSPFYKNLFEMQIKKGIDTQVYVPVSKNFNDKKRDYGDYTKLVKSYGKYDRYFFYIKHRKILKDIVNQFNISNYDILHAHSLFSNGYIAYKLNKKFDIPYIVAVRDTDVNTFFKKMPHLRKIGINILCNAKKVVFLSSSYKKKTIEQYLPKDIRQEVMNKSFVIPNGADQFWLNNKPTEIRSVCNKEIKIIFAGRISKRKNISTTIKACEVLINKGYKVKFTVVGRIEDQKEFKKIIKNDFVTYVKPQPKETLIKLYRDNEIFIMPSLTETFGLVYVEAMSQGLPVIYSKNQGFDGQFEEGIVGYNVENLNYLEIAKRIIDVIGNYEEISKNCIELSNKFDWEKIVMDYYNLYL